MKNPFNKNLEYKKDDYNSEIDKLEELRNKERESNNSYKNLQGYRFGEGKTESQMHQNNFGINPGR